LVVRTVDSSVDCLDDLWVAWLVDPLAETRVASRATPRAALWVGPLAVH